jgi:hypothetical protein
MPAGYVRGWLSFAKAVDHVELLAKCPREEAREGVLAALLDGEIQSRFADTHESIEATRWRSPIIFVDGIPDAPLIGHFQAIELSRANLERWWPAGEQEKLTAERTVPPSGIRTTTDENVETACGDWLESLSPQPRNKEAAFEAAKAAVKHIGVLSRKGFDRQWANRAPAGWKQAGRRKSRPVA